jgi:hypothetical protein
VRVARCIFSGGLSFSILANSISHDHPYLVVFSDVMRQSIPLRSRPNTLGGRRWYFVDERGKLSEKLYFMLDRFVSRKMARLTYRSQSLGTIDTILHRQEKLSQRLKGTQLRGPARGRIRSEIAAKLQRDEERFELIVLALCAAGRSRRTAQQRRREASKQRLEDAAQAMAAQRGVTSKWVVDTFAARVDELKNEAQSQRKRVSSNSIQDEPTIKIKKNVPHIDIGILGRLGYVRKGQLLGAQLG